MSRSEKAIMNDALVALSGEPESLYRRNNTGQAWQGKKVQVRTGELIRVEQGMVILRAARPITFGLPGSGDIEGAQQGFAVSVETKTDIGQQSEQQEKFQAAWERAGGIYILARSPAEAVSKVKSAISLRKR